MSGHKPLEQKQIYDRGRSVVPVSREEFDELQEEIARSGQNMFVFGKKKTVDDQQEDV